MSFKRFQFVATFLLTALFVIGCSKSDDDSAATTDKATKSAAETPAAAGDATDTFERAKAAYISTVRTAMDDWNQKITALEEKKNALPELAQAPVNAPMQELLDMRDVLGQKIESLENSTEESYAATQSEVDRELGALNTSYDKVVGLLK